MFFQKSLSLSYTPRPPAQARSTPHASTTPSSTHARLPSTPSSSKKSRGKRKAQVDSRRVPGPEIRLPEPNQPIPPNFLRNQLALLGTAGIVSGIKPTELPSTPGSSHAHPIVLSEDTPDPAPIGIPPSLLLFPSMLRLPCPCPPHEAILEALSQRKEVIPTLREMLHVVSSGQLSGAFRRRTSVPGSPPSKKRKLDHVPAGAVDWDVPYPFKAGDGPTDYVGEWSRQRVVVLMSKLTTLIQDAAYAADRKIRLNSSLEHSSVQKPSKRRTRAEEYQSKPYYRIKTNSSVSSSRYTSRQGSPSVLSDASNDTSRVGGMLDSGTGTLTPESLASLDQLLTLLLAASNERPVAEPPSTSSQSNQVTTGSTYDEEMFQSWLQILETLPPPEDHFQPAQHPEPGVSGNFDNLAHIAPDPSPSLSLDVPMQDSHIRQPLDDFAIDPELLALSAPTNEAPPLLYGSNMSTNPWDNSAFSLASPIPSMDSFTDPEPLTPISAGWELSLPEVFSSQSSVAGDSTPRHNFARFERIDSSQDNLGKAPHKGKKSVEVAGSVLVNSGRSTPDSTRGSASVVLSKMTKAEVLKAARERRQELAKALVDSTMAIWETTIEQGVLANLAQYYRDN